MKTYAHINANKEIVGIGMIYLEDGSFADQRLHDLVRDFGKDGAILRYGDMVRPQIIVNGKLVPDPQIAAVLIDTNEMPGGNGFEFDKTFRNSFRHESGFKVGVDMKKARDIVHERRRIKRSSEFAPLDVEATIPNKSNEAEQKRQVVRDKYASIQAQIDECATPDQLKAVMQANNL